MSASTPQRAFFIDPAGKTVAVPLGQAADVGQFGDYAPASVSQIRDYLLQERYGSTGQAALGGLESAGSMATLGLSTVLERAAGVSAEGIKGREEANPLASGTGSAVGILAPLLLTGGASAAVEGAEGASAAARAASMAGPSLLAKTGKAVAKAALRDLPEDASLAQRLAAKGLAAAAGGAVEGAGYEAGQLVHEAALGDPNLTAEAALARVGLSAATFGALSGGGGILGALAHEAAGVVGASDVSGKVAGWLEDFEANRNAKTAGGIQSEINRANKQLGREGFKKVALEMRDLGLVSSFSTPAQTLERADVLMGRAGATMGDVLKSADEVARAEGATLGDLGNVIRRARTEVLAPLEADPFQREAAGKLSDLLEELEAKGKNVTLEDLHQLRRQGDAALYGMRGTQDPYATAFRQALHDLRGIITDGIEAGVEKSGVPLDIWKTANREYQVAARAAEFAEKGLDRAHGNNLISPTEFLSTLAGGLGGGPVGGVVGGLATAAARRFGSGVLGSMARGLRGLLEGEEGALVANGTAEAIAAERRATLGQAVPGAALAETASNTTGGQLSSGSWWSRAVAPHISGPMTADQLRATGGVTAHTSAAARSFAVPGAAIAAMIPPRGVIAGAAIAARASAAPETAAALAVLAKAKSEVTKEVDSALLALAKNAPQAIGRTLAAKVSRRAADAVDARRLASSPELLQETLARQTDELHGHAPSVAQAAQMASARAVAFLASKAPATALPGLHGKAAQPSVAELGKFARYVEVAHQPLKVLEHARRGTLTPEHVGTVASVYPALYQHIQERAVEALMGSGGKVAHPRSRMMLSVLTGFRLDGGFNAVAANQAAFARTPDRSIMDRPVPNPNAGKLNMAGRVRTPTQGLAERLDGGK